MKRSTMEFYRSRLEAQVLPARGHLAVTAVSTAAVSDFTAELVARCNPGGVNAVLRALRVLLGFAVKQGILEKAPAVPMVEEPEPDDELPFVPRAETDAFLGALLDFEPDWRTPSSSPHSGRAFASASSSSSAGRT